MTGKQLAKIRKELCGTNTAHFGHLLGLGGKDATRSASVRRLEASNKIPEWFAIIARHLMVLRDLRFGEHSADDVKTIMQNLLPMRVQLGPPIGWKQAKED